MTSNAGRSPQSGWVIAGAVVAAMAAIATVYARVVVPSIKHEVMEDARVLVDESVRRVESAFSRMLAQHASQPHPHPGAVTQREYDSLNAVVIKRIDELARTMDRRLTAIEAKIR